MPQERNRVVLVSACLLGVACRYNGTSRRHEQVIEYLKDKIAVPVCPESLTGLPIPREAAEFDHGDGAMTRSGKNRVLLRDGTDVTERFLKGANDSLKISRIAKPHEAILKDRSPSCGVYYVYNRSRLVRGLGCFSAMLVLEGVPVRSEKDLES